MHGASGVLFQPQKVADSSAAFFYVPFGLSTNPSHHFVKVAELINKYGKFAGGLWAITPTWRVTTMSS
jgi:hypothetical protein